MIRMTTTLFLCLFIVCAAHAQLPVTEGLIVHLRADSLTGLEDGDPVSLWIDSAQDDPVDGTVGDVGSGVPEYKADVLFGKPVVRFNGAEALSSAQFAIPDLDAGATCVMVCTGDKTGVLHARLGHFGAWDAVAESLSQWTFARSRVRRRDRDFGSTTVGPWPAIRIP